MLIGFGSEDAVARLAAGGWSDSVGPLERYVVMSNKPPMYALLSPPLFWHAPVAEVVSGWAREFIGVDRYSAETTWLERKIDLWRALDMVVARHLQLPGCQDARPWIDKGLTCALDYFWGDWVIDYGATETDESPLPNMKSWHDRRIEDAWWFTEFSSALVLAVLSGRRDDVARLCEWPWAELKPEYSGMGGDLEDEYAFMFLLIASGLRDTPMVGIDKVGERIRKCRLKRPRLLLALWEAVESGNQTAFQEALLVSLKQFDAGPGSNGRYTTVERIAVPQTVIHQVAGWAGLEPLELPEKLAPYLITRETLGLVD